MAISSVTPSQVAAAGEGGHVYTPPTSPVAALPAAQTTGKGAVAPPPSAEQVAKAVKQVNDAFTQMGQDLHASIERDQNTGISVVKFQDMNTREVVRQYPSKEIIALAEAFDKSLEARGRLLNVKA